MGETEMFRFRILSHIFYLFMLTIFVSYPLGLPDGSWFIPSYALRNEFAWGNDTAPTNLPKQIFLYTWIATILWPAFFLFLKYQNNDNLPTEGQEDVKRQPDALYTSE